MARFSTYNFSRSNPLATLLGMLGQTSANNTSNANRASSAFQRIMDNRLTRKQQQMQQQQINRQNEMGWASLGVNAALGVANPFIAAATAPEIPNLVDIMSLQDLGGSGSIMTENLAKSKAFNFSGIPGLPGVSLQDLIGSR